MKLGQREWLEAVDTRVPQDSFFIRKNLPLQWLYVDESCSSYNWGVSCNRLKVADKHFRHRFNHKSEEQGTSVALRFLPQPDAIALVMWYVAENENAWLPRFYEQVTRIIKYNNFYVCLQSVPDFDIDWVRRGMCRCKALRGGVAWGFRDMITGDEHKTLSSSDWTFFYKFDNICSKQAVFARHLMRVCWGYRTWGSPIGVWSAIFPVFSVLGSLFS